MSSIEPHNFSGDIRECWATHQVFRGLGFIPDDIYISIGKDIKHPEAGACLFVILRAQGKEFTVTIGAYDNEKEAEAALDKWTSFVNLANGGAFGETALDAVYRSSYAFKNCVGLVLALHEKGIKPMMEWS